MSIIFFFNFQIIGWTSVNDQLVTLPYFDTSPGVLPIAIKYLNQSEGLENLAESEKLKILETS